MEFKRKGKERIMPKLNDAQVAEVSLEMVKHGVPVRFLHNGQCLNLITGEVQPKGINIMYQTVYWNFTKATSKKIAGWLNIKAVFSQEYEPKQCHTL